MSKYYYEKIAMHIELMYSDDPKIAEEAANWLLENLPVPEVEVTHE